MSGFVYNNVEGKIYYNGVQIAPPPPPRYQNESSNCDGSNISFTLGYTPEVDSVQVFLNGLLQESGSGKDYQISGTNITFSTAPETDDILLINYLAFD